MNTPYHFLGLAIFSILASMPLKAEVLHWPQLCSSGELYIKNTSSSPSNLWLQKFGKTLIREIEIEVEPKSSMTYSLDNIESSERYSLLNLNTPASIEVQYKCHKQFFLSNALEGGAQTFKKSNLPINKIWIQNLYTGNNSIEIELQDSSFKKIKTETLLLNPQENLIYSIKESANNWVYFKIQSSHKSSIFNLSSEGNLLPVKTTPQQSKIEAHAYYFLIESRDGQADSFIVQIKNENLAQQARDLILYPQKEKMLFAKIQKDHQGFNRNWSKSEKNHWSWSTSEVTGFGEIGSTACNGAPQQVEDRVDYWVNDPGLICFWNYRVKKELTPEQVAKGL